MADSQEPPENDLSARFAAFIGKWFRWLVLAGVAVAVGVMAQRFWPNKLPPLQDPTILERIFYSRSMIFGARLVIFVAVVYLLASMIALIVQNKWLSEVGPFKASKEPVGTLDQAARKLDQSLSE